MSAPQKGILTYKNSPINFLGEMLCLTDMWKAAGEQSGRGPSDWRALSSTQSFVDFLQDSVIAGKSGNEVFAVVRGGKAPGTWAHWQIGFAYAKYLSPEFHAWVNQAAREKMEAIAGGVSQLSSKSLEHITLIRKGVALFGSVLAHHKRLGMEVTQARLKANAVVLEQMGIDLRKELGWQPQPLAVQERTLNATQIGAQLGLKNREVNKLLEAQGLHTEERDAKNRIVWTPTVKGRKFGRYEDKTKAHAQGTVQPWVWFPSIVDELRPFTKSPEPAS